MRELKSRVAVITGGGSGFGREIAILCGAAGMRVVLADIDVTGMNGTEVRLPPQTECLSVRCDVSNYQSVDDLANATYHRFGECGVLFNNAGVGTAGPAWTSTLDDWTWTIGINLMGAVHGVRSFVPRMIQQGASGHVVNTASAAGLVATPGSSVYCASKFAVVGLTECLYHELRAANLPIGVSLLCPAFVDTGISSSERNRPSWLSATNPLAEEYAARVKRAIKSGKLTAADVAAATIEAVKEDRFYVLPHKRIKAAVEIRLNDVLEERQPTNTSAD
jgi:NAD(P)-dependent dehydrogenase (short-subunit alcohol dehydrogenase family)